MKVHSVLELIGRTPAVRLNFIYPDSPHEFWLKLEQLNPAGSVKDRLGLALIEGAEKRGELKTGGTIVEATSGNTGLGLAFVSAIKKYKCVFVMPDKVSEEKRAILRAYGADVVITPSDVEPNDPRSYLSVSRKIAAETKNCFYANQYHNLDNRNCHERTTGPEIWEDFGMSLDVFIAGAGTGGTMAGVSAYLKQKNPQIKSILADPIGSILSDVYYHGKVVTKPQPYKVEGVGEDMLPENVDFKLMDDVIQVGDRDSFQTTRKLVSSEGLCTGPSTGMALWAAHEYSKRLQKKSKLLVIAPDSGRAYLSKLFNDQWLKENNLL